MNKKEELTDTFAPEAIGKLRVGQILKFKMEDEVTIIKITKKVMKPTPRIWGEHIELASYNNGMSHNKHDLDRSAEMFKAYGVPYCRDCEVPVKEGATEEGDVKAYLREKANK